MFYKQHPKIMCVFCRLLSPLPPPSGVGITAVLRLAHYNRYRFHRCLGHTPFPSSGNSSSEKVESKRSWNSSVQKEPRINLLSRFFVCDMPTSRLSFHCPMKTNRLGEAEEHRIGAVLDGSCQSNNRLCSGIRQWNIKRRHKEVFCS